MLDQWIAEQGDQKSVFKTPYPLSEPKPDKAVIEELRKNNIYNED